MGIFLKNDQRGFGHTGIIAIILVILVVGGVGWWVWDKNKNDSPQQKAIEAAKCEGDDQDICKFFAAWNATDNYTLESTEEVEGETMKLLVKVEGEDKTYTKATGLFGPGEIEFITIGNTRYTKAGNTWYKQTLDPTQSLYPSRHESEGAAYTSFIDPTDGEMTYTKVGTEDCGDDKCFKYEVINANTPDITTYLWFDTKDYQLRRMQVDNAGTIYDTVFTYGNVSVSEPSPVKDLGENQYIVPGQTEPATMPSTGDDLDEEQLQDLLNQYQ